MELKYKEITEKIIGAAMKVYTALGNGVKEVIYQRSLEIEFKYPGLSYAGAFNMKIFYRGEEVGESRIDFFREYNNGRIKGADQIENVHHAQAKITWKHIT